MKDLSRYNLGHVWTKLETNEKGVRSEIVQTIASPVKENERALRILPTHL